MNSRTQQLNSLNKLLDIIDELREKCPWDKKQTFNSLRHLTIEETFELSEAIIENSESDIRNELGDLLLHVFFYAKIASENNSFDIGDVANSISKKLINRHPHVYGGLSFLNEEQVKRNWEEIKLKEGNKSVLSGLPKSLPPIIKAQRIQDKVSGVGFDWENLNQVRKKIDEELLELDVEIIDKNIEKIEEVFGDLLFSMINYARFLKIDPSMSLEKTNIKFINRFKFIEDKLNLMGKKINEMSVNEIELFWQESKF
tara:strand:- start:1614 stop:2384 length:771 start_codon:yes stop_codon:yes gene_type:complete